MEADPRERPLHKAVGVGRGRAGSTASTEGPALGPLGGSAINNPHRSIDGKKDDPTRPKRDRTQKLFSFQFPKSFGP